MNMTRKTIHDFSVRTGDGRDADLSAFAGKVCLVVNVASRCGYTPQYEGLERLHRSRGARGFTVLAFPSNDFGGQEPGADAEVAQFCRSRFDVTFPLFAKGPVQGPAAAEPWRLFAAEAGPPAWNFHKYLVGRDGRVICAFPSSVGPDDDRLVAAIERALEAPVPP
jgi:glutathione peroxidase